MADSNLDQLLKELDSLNKKIEKIEEKALKEVGQKIKRNLEERWLDGIDSKTGQAFKDLEKSTIDSRQRMRVKGTLSRLTNPKKSQQIATGRMFSQLNFKIHRANNEVEIGIIGDRIGNLEYQEKMGRTPIALTKEDEKDIDDILARLMKTL